MMEKKLFVTFSYFFIAAVTVAISLHLGWDHYHGGVPAHHLLADKNLLAISNWWGLVLLPLVTTFLLYRVQKKAFGSGNEIENERVSFRPQVQRFVFSLLFGTMLSAFFSFGYTDVCGYLILTLLPLSVVFPLYRAECLLGFVLGMTYTFGAVLPTGIGLLLVLISAALHFSLRPLLSFFVIKFSPVKVRNKENRG